MKSYLHRSCPELAGELETDWHRNSLKIYYQPVVDAKTGDIRSAEA
ncbi:MAG: hypothetical protein ACLR08_12520 [Dorea longicatena]